MYLFTLTTIPGRKWSISRFFLDEYLIGQDRGHYLSEVFTPRSGVKGLSGLPVQKLPAIMPVVVNLSIRKPPRDCCP